MSKLIVAAVTCALFVSSPWFDVSSANASGSSTVDSAITLTGTSQYTYANDSGTVYDGIGSFTFAMWVKPDSACTAANTECILVNKENSWEFALRSGYFDFAIMGSSQNWDWQGTRDGTFANLPKATTNGWTHAVYSVDRSTNTIRIFLNGRQVYSLTNATSIPSTGRDQT